MNKLVFRPLLISVILFSALFQLRAQEVENTRKWQLSPNVYFGGNLGLAFGTITSIDVSPLVGYHITPMFSAGVGVTYQYYNDSRINFNTSIYGGNVFAEFAPIKNGYLHAEIEMINFDDLNRLSMTGEKRRIWDTGVLLGGGFRQYISERSSINYTILWNLNDNPSSLYQNPIIRIGFNF